MFRPKIEISVYIAPSIQHFVSISDTSKHHQENLEENLKDSCYLCWFFTDSLGEIHY